MFWSVHSGIIAAIAVVFGRYAVLFLPASLQSDAAIRTIAVAVIIALSVLNYAGVRGGGRVQTALTIIKVAAIAMLVACGFLFAPASVPDAANTWPSTSRRTDGPVRSQARACHAPSPTSTPEERVARPAEPLTTQLGRPSSTCSLN